MATRKRKERRQRELIQAGRKAKEVAAAAAPRQSRSCKQREAELHRKLRQSPVTRLIDDIPASPQDQISVYPDTSKEYVFVSSEVLKSDLRYGLFTMIESTMATPKKPVAEKQWLLMIDGFDHLSFFPRAWLDISQYGGGIPGNVWCGVEDPINVPRLRSVRARRLFVRVAESCATPAMFDQLQEHLGAWRCYHCGRRGEVPQPTQCPSGSVCVGEEWRLGPQIHWLWVYEKDVQKPTAAA